MGLKQPSRISFDDAPKWRDRLEQGGQPAASGDIVTMSCMTGTDSTRAQLAARHPDAIAEAMEGWGVAWAARSFGVRAGEVRAVSNLVGRRHPASWNLTAALDALARAFGVLLAEPLP